MVDILQVINAESHDSNNTKESSEETQYKKDTSTHQPSHRTAPVGQSCLNLCVCGRGGGGEGGGAIVVKMQRLYTHTVDSTAHVCDYGNAGKTRSYTVEPRLSGHLCS